MRSPCPRAAPSASRRLALLGLAAAACTIPTAARAEEPPRDEAAVSEAEPAPTDEDSRENLDPAEPDGATPLSDDSLGYLESFAQPAPRLVDRATAGPHTAYAVAGVSHRGEPLLVAEVPFGPLAAIGGGIEDRLLVGEDADTATPVRDTVMWFRLRAPRGSWFRHQPALSLTFERSMGDGLQRAAEVRAVATERWDSSRAGALQATLGVGIWEIATPQSRLSQQSARARTRPFAGVAWTPPSYPNTSILLEGSYGPSALGGRPRLDWRLGWGARYRVYSWTSIDLLVRNRQDAGLSGSTVMVRLSIDAV